MNCDIENVRKIAAEIHAKLDACDNGEGMECANLDASLKRYAQACCDFVMGVREWAHCIFSGKSQFDREAERLWREEGRKLFLRAEAAWQQCKNFEGPCWDLPGQGHLTAGLWYLDHVLSNWVSPKLSVAPGPRVTLAGDLDEMRAQVESLAPLPENWRPGDKSQRTRYEKAKSS